VHESRILQVTLSGTLKDSMNALDFSLLLPEVMTIADEMDAQLMQTMGIIFSKVVPRKEINCDQTACQDLFSVGVG